MSKVQNEVSKRIKADYERFKNNTSKGFFTSSYDYKEEQEELESILKDFAKQKNISYGDVKRLIKNILQGDETE